MNDAPCRDCASREVGCHAGMREIQGVCGRTEDGAGKPLHSLYRRHGQKAKSRALGEISKKGEEIDTCVKHRNVYVV